MLRRALIFGLFFSACAEDPGRIAIRFSWVEEPPLASGLFIHAAVEQRAVLTEAGELLAADVQPLDDTVHFELDVPNGDNRAVILEVRTGADRTRSTIRYFGVSELFSVRAGVETEVAVRLQLQRVARVPVENALSIQGSPPENRVRNPRVVLELESFGARAIAVAKDIGFSIGLVERDVTELTIRTPEPGRQILEIPYDLNEGLCAADDCADGPRPVYAKAINQLGYESEVYSLEAFLDSTPPTLFAESVAIELEPSLTNVLRRVETAGAGTTVRVRFALDEAASLSRIESETGGIRFEQIESAGTEQIHAWTVPAGAADQPPTGTHALSLMARDLAGNVATFPLTSIEVDVTPPRPPDVDRVILARSPFGSAETNAAPATVLTGEPGAVEPYSYILVRGTGAEIARSRADERGAFEAIDLGARGRESLTVGAADAAGNVSEAPVRRAVWTFAIAPDRVDTGDQSGATLTIGGRGASRDERAAAQSPDRAALVAGGKIAWKRNAARDIYPRSIDGAGAYDELRARTVVVGGVANSEVDHDAALVWEWDGVSWRGVEPNGAIPEPRARTALTYDAARRRVLMFGGSLRGFEAKALSDTWEWDGYSWTEGPIGPTRQEHALVYDLARSRAVMFGGWDDDHVAHDTTFEWDGETWTEIATPSRPPGRRGHAMAYDLDRGVVVLFGGRDQSSTRIADTWEYDGVDWVERTPLSGAPSPRYAHSMTYDRRRGRVVLFGGYNGDESNDTWEWDGTSWTEIDTPSRPEVRDNHPLVFHAALSRVLVLGGDGKSDVWQYDGATWTDHTPKSGRPSPRVLPGLTEDLARGRIVLFGGVAANGYANDTWEWNGEHWIERRPLGALPSGRGGGALAYDPGRDQLLMFGGSVRGVRSGETWRYDGDTWTELDPPSPAPGARVFHAMRYDEARGAIMLIGGSDDQTNTIGDVWEWTGGAWSRLGDLPGPREQQGLTYDPQRGRVLSFGGYTDDGVTQDFLEFDGTTWSTRIPPLILPSRRQGHLFIFDPRAGRSLMIGGCTTQNIGFINFTCYVETPDIWEWNSATSTWTGGQAPIELITRHWSSGLYSTLFERVFVFGGFRNYGANNDHFELETTGWIERRPDPLAPGAIADHAVVHDAARGRPVLFGGRNASGALLGGTWEWTGIAWVARTPSSSNPPARAAHALAYDAASSTTLLFGGTGSSGALADTWSWDGSRWSSRNPAAPPAARAGHAMAYDAARANVVLFGGRGATSALRDDTATFAGGQWTALTLAARPLPRADHAMAYDAARGEVVLFGGLGAGGARSDTWIWSGTAWSVRNAAGPSARHGHAMFYSPERARVVLHGGCADDPCTSPLGDQWEWDGTAWHEVSLEEPPPEARFGHAAVAGAGGRAIMIGGEDAGGRLAGTFIAELTAAMTPEVRLTAAWPAGQIDRRRVEHIELRAVAGGRSHLDVAGANTPADGAILRAFDVVAGRFVELASNTSAEPAELVWASSTTEEAQALFGGGEVLVSLSPRGGFSDPADAIEVDYVEIKVFVSDAHLPAICGDGFVNHDRAEACDDGNGANLDGCSATCTVERFHTCAGEPSACAECGDGARAAIEACDDANLINGDGCNDACRIERTP